MRRQAQPVSSPLSLLLLPLLLAVVLLSSAVAAFDISTTCAYAIPSNGSIPSSWTVRAFTLIVSDGVVVNLLDSTRPAVLVNGSTPGPRIEVNEFDWVEITVISQQQNESMTGIHWHGLHQRTTPYNDGAAGITQCGIAPGLNLTYSFCAYPSGTYWYHGHNNQQYTAGLYGALVINPYSPSSLLQPSLYAQDWAWLAADFYNTPMPVLLDWFLSPASQGTEPQPDTVTVNGAFTNTTHLYVRSTDTVIVRLVNAAALDMFYFSVDGLDMTVLQVDGSEVQPTNVSTIMLNVAQRATVSLSFPAFVALYPHVDKIYFRVSQMSDFDFSTQTFSPAYEPNYVPQPFFLGVIHIDAADSSDKSFPVYDSQHTPQAPSNFSFADLNDLDLRPLNWEAISYTYFGVDISNMQVPLPTTSLSLTVSFADNGAGVNLAYMNNVSFVMPGMDALMVSDGTLPPLYQQVVDASLGIAVVPTPDPVIAPMYPNSSYYQVPTNSVVEMTILNTDDGPHPFHLHGHHFWIVSSSDYPEAEFNYANQWLIRDTVSVPPGGFAIIRIIANNPGAWMFHCHIDWHLSAGLGVMFMEGTSSLGPNYMKLPANHLAICDNGVRQQVIAATSHWLLEHNNTQFTQPASSSSSSSSSALPLPSSSTGGAPAVGATSVSSHPLFHPPNGASSRSAAPWLLALLLVAATACMAAL